MDEQILVANGWEAIEQTPSTALGFSHPDEPKVALVRRQYSKLREVPIVRMLLARRDPWQFAVVDNETETILTEATFRTKRAAQERLQEYLDQNPP